MSLELYHASHSTCSQKVRLVLAEKGVAWVDHRIDLGRKEQLRPDYLRLNPNGVVPTLVDDGAVVLDSSVICEYLDEAFPTPALVPQGLAARARMRAWMRHFEEVATAAIRVPSFNSAFLYRFAGQSAEAFRRDEVETRNVRKALFIRMDGPTGFSQREMDLSLDQLDHTCARMDAALDGAGPWLMGEMFTLADVVVTPTIDRMNDLGLSRIWAGRYPAMTAWFERIKGRPCFLTTFYPGSRVSEFLPLSPV